MDLTQPGICPETSDLPRTPRAEHCEVEGQGRSEDSDELAEEGQERGEEDANLDAWLRAQYASDFLASMEATRPDIIRAAPVQHVLRGLARPLRADGDYDFYHLSHTTTRGYTFWSHSWHGSVRRKIATVFFLHLATPATIIGTAAAVSVCILFGLGLLPDDAGQSWWCLTTGCLSYMFAMLFWRPQQPVFLDRVCISQTKQDLQVEALLSLRAILQNADSMLVLWDSSWAHRLFVCLRTGRLHPQQALR
ncbi:Rai14 [Symbiodinium sp. CCMP2592]|nr:Rai14 [Symbiodinium sp. CCMP2592]